MASLSEHDYRCLTAGKEGEDLINLLLRNFASLRSGVIPESPVSVIPTAIVCECGCTDIRESSDGRDTCTGCGRVYGISQLKMGVGVQRENYGAYVPVHQYKRLTRFREVLRQLQGLGEGFIPEHVRDVLRADAAKFRSPVLTPKLVRFFLKRHKLGAYGEHATRLAVECGNGKYKPLMLSSDVSAHLEQMFKQCDRVWSRVKKQVKKHRFFDRQNFPSYSTMIYNFLLLMDLPKHAQYVKPYLLQSSKLAQRQQIFWFFFCYCLKWDFRRIYGEINVQTNVSKATQNAHKRPRSPGACLTQRPSTSQVTSDHAEHLRKQKSRRKKQRQAQIPTFQPTTQKARNTQIRRKKRRHAMSALCLPPTHEHRKQDAKTPTLSRSFSTMDLSMLCQIPPIPAYRPKLKETVFSFRSTFGEQPKRPLSRPPSILDLMKTLSRKSPVKLAASSDELGPPPSSIGDLGGFPTATQVTPLPTISESLAKLRLP